MQTHANIAATTRQIRAALTGHPHVRQALIFGSVASGRARPDSDLDIAVAADQALDSAEKTRLIQSLAVATGRPVDLIDLKVVGEPLLGQILKSGIRILGSNADQAELIRRHLFDTEDFLPYVTRLLRERRQAWIG